MTVRCPHCGSRDLRPSRSQGWVEQVCRLLGIVYLRCRDCDERFSRALWDLSNLFYARCPRCYRLDLAKWQLDHYRVPIRWTAMLKIGAKAHRCEACRHNFVSFRPAKLRYVRPGARAV
jgi:DNA-directed RNA polymerase subunit RPC12/RpoP